ncbi:MAG: MurT ligase domain-containing protein [Patescibacteria group bacterium]|nr:MurT ligase domain-containing protein [Patescibacteria group bacterium]
MINLFLILLGKFTLLISRSLNLGHGSTWPGHVALSINKNFIKQIFKKSKSKIVFIAGTNGKTTTAKLIQTILEQNGKKVFINQSGANLLNGISSSIIEHSTMFGKIRCDYFIFEIDENTLPLSVSEITPDYLIILNLFRDQLDRYGEVDTIAKNWKKSINKLPESSLVFLNVDDPKIAYIGKGINAKKLFFGLNDKGLGQKDFQHASDSLYCPNCDEKLEYETVFYSHLGIWHCNKCNLKRPLLSIDNTSYYPMSGIYNRYNTLASVLFAKTIGIDETNINNALENYSPAFGRQEKIIIDNKNIQLFLSKNPTSFNESLRTIKELNAKNILIVLNNRIPDGLDVSWIWDIDIEKYVDGFNQIFVSGDRCFDMGLRIKYALENQKSKIKNQNYNSKFKILENLNDAIKISLEKTPEKNVLYILPTYSAMLEIRKILTGRKIL